MKHTALNGISAIALMLGASSAASAQEDAVQPSTKCVAFSANMKFDCYRDYAQVTQFLKDAAAAYPELASLQSIGKSYQGRDIWVLTITDPSTGKHDQKPAMWVEGGIDSDEVTSVETSLATIHRLLTARDSATLELRRTRTFYIAPNVIPDTSELYHHTPLRPTDSTMRPYDEDNDGLLDEDAPEDLDGDGEITMMRWKDANGQFVLDERDSRVMRTRKFNDTGPFYSTSSEGIDNDGDGKINEDWLGGIDPNRNYPGGWKGADQVGAGPYAGSEYEIQALLNFNVNNPNIAASIHHHTHGGVILFPFGIPGMLPPPADMTLFKEASVKGLEITGYDLATNIFDWNWPRGSENRKAGQVWRDKDGKVRQGEYNASASNGNAWAPEPVKEYEYGTYPAYGGSIDTTYPQFGIFGFGLELHQTTRDLNGDNKVDEVDRVMHNDRTLKGVAFKPWTKFNHPSLGEVEIGGWLKMGSNNPLPHLLPAEVKKGVDFSLYLASLTAQLSISDVKVTPAPGGVYSIKAKVSNLGKLPTELAIRKGQLGALPVFATINLPKGASLVTSTARHDLGTIQGNSVADTEWIVSAPEGSEITITAAHPKGGTSSRTVRIDQ